MKARAAAMLAAGLCLWPMAAEAAGTLSVGSVGTATVTATIGNASTSGSLPSATWSDSTGLGLGWNGTIAVTVFNLTGAWSASGGSAALGTTSSPIYTGAGSGYYRVSVTSCTFNPTGSALAFSFAGLETGSGTATVAPLTTATSSIGTSGVQITWAAQGASAISCPYAAGNAYTIKVGNLAGSALTLADNNASATITPQAGTIATAPVFVNPTAAVPGGTATAVGSEVKFLSAALTTGGGSYSVVPYGSLAYDASVWASTYTATIQYTIYSGP
ncbi:MAG: hypothetical protein ACYDGR_05610 [Candidatus Dormibacteria bacterium]